MSEEQRLGTAIRTISEKYLPNVLKANDRLGILKWSIRLGGYANRLALLAGDESEEPVEIVTGPNPPDQTLSMADRNRAWQGKRPEYDAAVDQIMNASPGTVPGEEFDLLKKSGLHGVAVALGRWGPPGLTGGIDYGAGDPWGGYWGASETQPDSGGYVATIWAGSEKVYTGPNTPGPTDINELGFAHGLNANLNGPA